MQPALPAWLAGIDVDRGRLFETGDLDEARERTARVFNPHRLAVLGRGQRLRARMDHLPFGGLSLNRLTWGSAVAVDPDRLGHYYLLSIAARGRAVFHLGGLGGRAVQVAPGQAGLVSAAPRFHFTTDADFEQWVVRFDRAALESAWLALAGRPAAGPIDFEAALPADGAAARALEPVLGLLAAGLRGDFEPQGLRHLPARVEEQFLTTLLLHQPHSQFGAMAAPGAAWAEAPRAAGRHVRRAEEWMLAHLDEPLTVSAVARGCGVATRTLQAGFQLAHGHGPMQWLRTRRLEAVRAALRADDSPRPSVTRTALRFGFTHLGEFSRAYRAAFGETPSETLARRH